MRAVVFVVVAVAITIGGTPMASSSNETAIDVIHREIRAALLRGETVEMDGFGTFRVQRARVFRSDPPRERTLPLFTFARGFVESVLEQKPACPAVKAPKLVARAARESHEKPEALTAALQAWVQSACAALKTNQAVTWADLGLIKVATKEGQDAIPITDGEGRTTKLQASPWRGVVFSASEELKAALDSTHSAH